MRALTGRIAIALGLVACSRPGPNDAPASEAVATIALAPSTTTQKPPANGEAPAPRAGRVKVTEAEQDSDALTLVRARRLEAKGEGRVLVVYVSATWCEPCKRLKAELASGRLDERLAKVTLLAFDADRDGDRLGAAGYSYRFVPYVALPGPDGRPADARAATGKGGDAWRELLGKLDAWQRDAVVR